MFKSTRMMFSLLILILLTACYPNLTGIWTLTITTESWGSYPDCRVDNVQTHYFQVTQDGGEVEGYSVSSPQSGIASGQAGDFKFFGQIPGRLSGDDIYLRFWIPNSSEAMGCGDSYDATGSLKGGVISGTFVGGDCHSQYAGANGRTQVYNVTEKKWEWIDGCWHTGSFSAEINP